VVTFVIGDSCLDVKNQSCVPVCPVDCIYEGDRMLYINPVECVDCGACERTCPEMAISYAKDLPVDQRHFARINREVFATIGNPFGARRHGPLGFDHPEIEPGTAP
jgi:NAD-dependent dihydropyrimidine dehydrogenase PreA subunit